MKSLIEIVELAVPKLKKTKLMLEGRELSTTSSVVVEQYGSILLSFDVATVHLYVLML